MTTRKKAKEARAEGGSGRAAAKAPVEGTLSSFPIVGIGASAGGLAAFEAFFSGFPTSEDPGMAFVVVQHLAPAHESVLADILQRRTRMQVSEVNASMAVEVNRVYVIPPNRDMALLNGTLQVFEPTAARGHRLPVDFLFRSLAQDQRERAVGIVLSGTGSDGTLGVRAIKAEGGMVMAQTPTSTEFDGMPSSAIATGLVDYELEPSEMAVQLMAYVRHASSTSRVPATERPQESETALKKIFILLRDQTGHDFSQYKPNTILRRINRRMAVHQIDSIENFVRFLQQTPKEVDALFKDIFIGVTEFFRDPEAFGALEKEVIPRLFDDKPAGAAIRVWSAGCSTGEEAYSVAILLQEHMTALKSSYKAQVFATDIDGRAIATARAGIYPASIATHVSPERLARFFTPIGDGGGYRVHKAIRDMLVFSEHDLIRDPPFSRLDLICCRNLMIYLGGELQKKLIPMFHYALTHEGTLFLGTSETVGERSDLFALLDRKSRIYRRKESAQSGGRAAHAGLLPVQRPSISPPAVVAPKLAGPRKPSLRELTEQTLLSYVAQVGALVNSQGDIVYLHGRSGMYLEPSVGETGGNSILTMAREGLSRDLSHALHRAVATGEVVHAAALRVKTNSHYTAVKLTVCPVAPAPQVTAEALYLVILEQMPAAEAPDSTSHGAAGSAVAPTELDARVESLSEELHAKDEYLQAANEELETSNEELKSSNEEMQSVNEELQSSNEELETSKEELQSINEELITVNAEMQTRVSDLSRASNDMNNLLASTGVGSIFVDHELRILRFTPAATRLVNLIAVDVGRPLAHFAPNLVQYDRLVEDTRSVLATLVPKNVDVQMKGGDWYQMRILPYRTLDNVIEGAVITFMDISEMVRTREALQKANELMRLAVVVRDAYDAVTVQDLDGRILAWNPGAVRMYGWTEAEALQMNVRERIPKELREKATARMHQLSRDETLKPYPTRRLTKAGEVVEIWMTGTALVNEEGRMYAIATTERKAGQARTTEAHDAEQG